MVSDSAQLYTIEGIAAGILVVLTVFFVFNTTSIYTSGDSHISDMQMEILGNDALRMMDTPMSLNATSPLKDIVEQDKGENFRVLFLNYTNNRTLLKPDNIQFSASYTCRNVLTKSTSSVPIVETRPITGGEHAVRVTKWVIVNKKVCDHASLSAAEDRAVLVEVVMWRD